MTSFETSVISLNSSLTEVVFPVPVGPSMIVFVGRSPLIKGFTLWDIASISLSLNLKTSGI
jgi:hypothetical protein